MSPRVPRAAAQRGSVRVLAERMQDERRARRWPVAELARRAGVSRTTVWRAAAGRPVSLGTGLALSLAVTDPTADFGREVDVEAGEAWL